VDPDKERATNAKKGKMWLTEAQHLEICFNPEPVEVAIVLTASTPGRKASGDFIFCPSLLGTSVICSSLLCNISFAPL
jgi:hypothetical protein